MISKIVVPNLGATGTDVTLVSWLVKTGDYVKAGSPLFSVSTDKAEMEVEAFRDGYLREILAEPGAVVELGEEVAILSDSLEESLPIVIRTGQSSIVNRQTTQAKAQSSQETIVSSLRASRPAPIQSPQDRIASDGLLAMFRRMVLIRRFEDYLHQLFLQGLVPGTLHQCQGQEAVAVGVCSALRRDDVMFSTHRPVGHFLAKGTSARSIAAEIWGKATGCAGGKGGQMHLVDAAVGAMPSNAIVGANIPIATGAALGFRMRGLDRIAVSFFGDGTTNIGAFHEGINLAAVKDAPVVFVCENNLYAASTHVSLTMRISEIAERAKAYGIPGRSVDGMDVIAVYDSMAEAVSRARRGVGPTLLEYKTYRYAGHSRGDPGGYRKKDEVQQWRQYDPISRARKSLIEEYQQKASDLDDLEQACQEEVEEAVRFAQASPDPPTESCFGPVYAERERT
jgi:acetoin:2,6-dichlorophenolindophenol oxidoreductase subunit alpha